MKLKSSSTISDVCVLFLWPSQHTLRYNVKLFWGKRSYVRGLRRRSSCVEFVNYDVLIYPCLLYGTAWMWSLRSWAGSLWNCVFLDAAHLSIYQLPPLFSLLDYSLQLLTALSLVCLLFSAEFYDDSLKPKPGHAILISRLLWELWFTPGRIFLHPKTSFYSKFAVKKTRSFLSNICNHISQHGLTSTGFFLLLLWFYLVTE